MKLRNTAIALGVGAATATGLSLLKVNKEVVIGSTAVVTGAAGFLLSQKKTTQDQTAQKNIDKFTEMDLGGNSNEDFIAYWDLNEFKQLLQKGIEIGSQYFFLIKNVGVCLFVRETDFIGTRVFERDEKELSIHAEGLNDDALFDLESEEEAKEFDRLRFESGKLYEGDLCEWFQISDELFKQVNTKIKEGYTRLKMIVKPLELDETKFSEEEIRDLKDKVFTNNLRIRSGGKCDISPFNANIKFQYVSDVDRIDLDNTYNGKSLFITNALAKQLVEKKAGDVWENHFEALRNGELEDEKENYEKAIEYYSKAIELIDINAIGFHKRAKDYLMLSEYEKALKDSDQSIRLDSKYYYYGLRGTIKYYLNDYGGAINDFKKSIEINSENANAYYFLGVVNEEVKDFESALENYSEAIKINPKNAFAYSKRGNAKSELEEYKSAIDDYSQAINLDSNLIDAYFGRGNAKAYIDEHEDAILDYSKAIEIDPTHENSYFNRALSKDEISDYEGCIDDLNKTIELNPENASAFNIRGLTKYNDIDDWDGAVEDFKKAIKIDPTFARAFYNLGDIIYDLADNADNDETKYMEEAIEYFTKALELDPTIEEVYRYRGWARNRIGDYENAISDFTELIDLDENNAEAHNDRASAKIELKDFEGAIQDTSKALEIEKNSNSEEFSEEAYKLRGQAKKELGDIKGSAEDICTANKMNLEGWDSIIKSDPEASNFKVRAGIKKDLDDIKGACEDWKKAAELGDEDAAKLLEKHCK